MQWIKKLSFSDPAVPPSFHQRRTVTFHTKLLKKLFRRLPQDPSAPGLVRICSIERSGPTLRWQSVDSSFPSVILTGFVRLVWTFNVFKLSEPAGRQTGMSVTDWYSRPSCSSSGIVKIFYDLPLQVRFLAFRDSRARYFETIDATDCTRSSLEMKPVYSTNTSWFLFFRYRDPMAPPKPPINFFMIINGLIFIDTKKKLFEIYWTVIKLVLNLKFSNYGLFSLNHPVKVFCPHIKRENFRC